MVQTKAYVRSLKLHAVHKCLNSSNGRAQRFVRWFHTFHWRFFSCSMMSTISGSTSEMSALSCFGHCSTQQQSQSVTPSPSCTYQLEKHVQIKMAAFDSAITDVSCTLSIIWSFTRSQFPTPISMFYIYCLYCRYNCHWNRREDIPVTYIFAMVMATSKMVKDHEQFRGLLVSRTYVSRFFNSFRCTSELNLKRQLQMALST